MTCLTALLIFLNAHVFDRPELGWVLGDQKTDVYTWITYREKGDDEKKQEHLHYFAFNRDPKDYRKGTMEKTGTCTLEGGKVVDVLEWKTILKRPK